MKRWQKIISLAGVITTGVLLFNASIFAPSPTGQMSLMSHRGVHQQFDMKHVNNETCTAEKMFSPSHMYLENTLASMRAAISYGADIIEIDVHPTTDGEFAVFHDWTLGCRTNGTGRTRDQSSTQLRKLDIGYGYTADDGKTYPFRGKFIGQMPMLSEVLDSFPNRRFLLNVKSRSQKEGRLLISYLETRKIATNRIVVYGHHIPIIEIKTLNSTLITLSKQQAKSCLKGYALTGWFGRVPKSCHNSWVPIPENYRWAIWGWPNKFQHRMTKAGSEVALIGPQTRDRAAPAIDSVPQIKSVPQDFGGIVWTNRIEVIGPALKARESARAN